MKINFALAFAALSFATAAAAVPTVYTDEAAFNAAISGATNWSFGFTLTDIDLGGSYTLGPVTFVSNGELLGYNDGGYGAAPYVGASFNPNMTPDPTFTITSLTSALGLHLGSYFLGAGQQTIIYTSGGISGSLFVPESPATTFIGFIDSSPITAAFAYTGELDVVRFTTGIGSVPEPASWALMIVGFGLVGLASRRRSTAVAA